MISKCPFCKSEDGFYMKETVSRELYFDFWKEPEGMSEETVIYDGKRMYCRNCRKNLTNFIKSEEVEE